MNNEYTWIDRAITTIKTGLVNRLDSPDGKIKVYKCGTIIRIDIKI